MSDYDNLIRQSFGSANPALPQVVGNIDENPDNAARAMELGRITGAPASAIFGDLEEFERQNKAQLASSIVRNNVHLSDWVQSDPMVPKVANDDYGNLDTVSQKTSLLDLPMRVLRAPEALGKIMFPGDPFERFTEGGPLGSWILRDDNVLKNYPFAGAVAAGLGTPIELVLRGLGGVQNTAADAAKNLIEAAGAPGLGRDVGAMVQSAGLTGRTGLIEHPVFKAADQYFGAKSYIENGREPPPTVLPEYDAFRAERNAKNVESLAEVVADAQQSLVRERNPDLFRDFVARHTDAEIGISGDAVAMLYGDKAPLPDDGILGWAPNIASQLELAKRSGDDVSIPLADWVAKVDPEVMKALQEDIRVRPGAITAREAQLSAELQAEGGPKPPPLPEEVPTLRGATALEPMFSIGDRKLQLQRMAQEQTTGQFGIEQGFHDFNLMDENGQVVGAINISTQQGGKKLYVDNITGVNGLGPRDFGPALMRDLLKQIKAEFPDATSISGHRVSGAREAAGKEMSMPEATVKLDAATVEEMANFQQALQEQHWARYADGIDVNLKPTETYTANERAITKVVQDELARIVPQGVDTFAVGGIRGTDQRPIHGAYLPSATRPPSIIFSLLSDNPLNTARHEAIHHLRMYGFFKPNEWATLEAQALAGGWLKKHDIDSKYFDAHPTLKLEEAIAEEFQAWAKQRDALGERAKQTALESSPLDAIFQKMYDFLMSIKEKVAQILGHQPTWEELFQSTLEGDIGARKGTEPINPAAFKAKMQFGEERQVFERANALGMTIEQYKRYEKLINERHVEDVAATTKRVEAAQRKTQTAAWKAERAELRKTVVDEINLRPDIAADNYFADGVLYGNKVPDHQKLGTDFLTPEQRQSLPRDYYNKSGVHPDDLAGLFGYPDGASLIAHLSGLSEIRRQSGMRPIDFKRRMIDIETDRQMRLRHGVLEDNIVDAVKEQVASETQLNLLAEETVALGMRSGDTAPFDQRTIKQWVEEEFEKSSVTSVNSDRYLAAAGRAGKAAEMALLKEKPADAFRAKQKQYYATLLARHAIEFEARAAKFEKLAARLSKREVKAVEPEYLDFIHQLLLDAGTPIKRSADEILSSKDAYGNADLAGFVASKAGEGWDLAVSEALQQGPPKALDAMNVAEMQDFMDAVTSLNHVGRAVRKIEIAGEKADWLDWRQKVIDNIEQLPARSRDSQGRWLYKIDASLTRMEEIAKDLDLRKELGPLHQAVIEPMMRSKAKEFDLMTDLSKHFQETRGDFGKEWRRSLDDTINQDILHDPYTQAPYDMTRQNLIQIMLNWGNRSNIRKFVQGAAVARWGRRLDREEFSVYEAQIKSLIDKHATAQDWQFVQRMWQPFEGWREQMETVSRNTSGVVPKMVEVGEVETPHGTFKGGYWPVKYDRLGSNAAVIEDRKPNTSDIFSQDYFRAATAKGYLKERTGYVDFVDISTSLEQAAGTMQQTIHDIAFRDSLIQAGRVFYDKGIRAAIRKHYGSEYEAQLVPWLRRIAHQFSTDDTSIAGYNDFMRRVRINLVGHALPLNLKVILSPDIGVPNPRAWASYLANRSENVKLAMERSDEIRHLVYNMDRDFRESLDRVTLDPTTGDLQKKAVRWGFLPIAKVSQEFRISTFVDQYYKALGRGKTETEAALIADSFVRERHGAASVVDLPAVMQSNEAMKMLTMFYGYFNTMYNWQRQLPGNVRRGEAKDFAVNGFGSVVVGAAFGAVLFNQRKQDDSWFKIISKALLLQPLSTIPVLNTAAAYFAEGYAPRTPIASLLGAAGSIVTDVKKLAKGERLKTMKPVQHVSNVVGLSTGLPLAQIGRTGQFGMDIATGQQRPKNIQEYARGIITGEAKLKR